MKKLRDWFDQITLYFPVLLMGLLALATYWLVRSTPLLEQRAPSATAQHQPDYFMHQFSVKTFDPSGKLKSEVKGRTHAIFRIPTHLKLNRSRSTPSTKTET